MKQEKILSPNALRILKILFKNSHSADYTDVKKELSLKPTTLRSHIFRLKKFGYVEKDKFNRLHLTAKGYNFINHAEYRNDPDVYQIHELVSAVSDKKKIKENINFAKSKLEDIKGKFIYWKIEVSGNFDPKLSDFKAYDAFQEFYYKDPITFKKDMKKVFDPNTRTLTFNVKILDGVEAEIKFNLDKVRRSTFKLDFLLSSKFHEKSNKFDLKKFLENLKFNINFYNRWCFGGLRSKPVSLFNFEIKTFQLSEHRYKGYYDSFIFSFNIDLDTKFSMITRDENNDLVLILTKKIKTNQRYIDKYIEFPKSFIDKL